MDAMSVVTMKSQSNPNLSYEIRQAKNGHIYCTCPAWKYQRKPVQERTCKHIKALAQCMQRVHSAA